MFRAVGCVEVYRIDVRCILYYYILLYYIIYYSYYYILYYTLPFTSDLYSLSSLPSFSSDLSSSSLPFLSHHSSPLPLLSHPFLLNLSFLFRSSPIISSFKVYVSGLLYTYLYSIDISSQFDPACFIGVDG